MKKFSKLLAIVLAIAVVICPMMSVVANASGTPAGDFMLEAVDSTTLKLTISSTNGFLVYKAVIQSTGTLTVPTSTNDYDMVVGVEKDEYNKPKISSNPSGNETTILVYPTDEETIELYSRVAVLITVSEGATARLTNIQAANDGDEEGPASDAELLSFLGVENAADGDIDYTVEGVEERGEAKAEDPHTHVYNQETVQDQTTLKTPATCTEPAVYYKTCECGEVSTSDSDTYSFGSPNGHTPSNTETYPQTGATCVADAIYFQECSVCNEPLDTTWTKTNSHLDVAHTWGEWSAVTGATCTQNGTHTRYCTVAGCDAYETVEAEDSKDPNTHSGVLGETYYDLGDGTHAQKYACCGAYGTPAEHRFDYTSNENGTHDGECLDCGATVDDEACDTNNDGACSKCGYKAAPAIPVDPNFDTLAASIGVDPDALKITFRIKTTNFNAYDNVQLCLTSGKYDVTTFNETDPNVVTVNKSEMTPAGSYTTFVYKEFMLYELGLGFSYQLKGYKGGECVATSTLVETTVVDIVKNWVTASSAQVTKTLGTDIIKVAEEAKIQFGNTKVGSDLYNAPSLIGSFDMSNATANVPTLNNVKNHVVENASPFIEDLVLTSVATNKVPTLTLRIGSKANPYTDPSKFAMNVAFTDPLTGSQSFTLASDKFATAGGRYVTTTFDQIPLYASNSTITITLRYQGSKVATITYSLDSYYSAKLAAGTSPLEAALAKLGASARAQFIK